MNVLYLPGFRQVEDLADQYYRMIWYLHPLNERLGKVLLPTIFPPPRVLPFPSYLDTGVRAFESVLAPHVEFFSADEAASWHTAISVADIVVRWCHDLNTADHEIRVLMERALSRKKVWFVDRHQSQYEGSFYLKLSHDANPDRARDLVECRDKFDDLAQELTGHEIGYLYGTGPSLSLAMQRNVSDGISVACNSMVRNRDLMDHLQPRVIVIGDPIFHAGPSSYAGQFRACLLDSMARYDAFLIVPFRDYKLYIENLPGHLRNRIVGIPFEQGGHVNLDLRQNFCVKTTSNILTLFLIPLAATFFPRIGIMGCDGRPLAERDYFWKHDPKSQFNDQMEPIRRAHPSFFTIDYNDYYLTHCAVLEEWLSAAEIKGIAIANLTPSYIPALQKRTPDDIGTLV